MVPLSGNGYYLRHRATVMRVTLPGRTAWNRYCFFLIGVVREIAVPRRPEASIEPPDRAVKARFGSYKKDWSRSENARQMRA